MIWGMTPADLTLVTPLNEVLALAGLPRVGLEHLALAQVALLGGDRALAAVPTARRRRRRRRGGGIGFLGLCCCLLPLALAALIGYLVWSRRKGQDPRTAISGLGSSFGGTPSAGSHPAPPPPGGSTSPGGATPPPPPGGTTTASGDVPPPTDGEVPPPPASGRPAPPPPPGASDPGTPPRED